MIVDPQKRPFLQILQPIRYLLSPSKVLPAGVTVAGWDFNPLDLYVLQGVHNNLVENAIRPTALGKKNWIFFGSEDAGQQSAIIYSILETCRKLGINQQAYLTDILSRLPELTNQQIKNLTPAKWQEARLKKIA